MAATIAHEINNPLAATMNSLFLVLQDPSLSESARQRLNVAERQLKRIARLTKQTLGFYKEAGPPTTVNLPELVDEVLDLFAPKLRDKSIHVSASTMVLRPRQAIEGELRQIVSNLVANSIDAVSHNGTLHVRTACPVQLNARSMMRLTIADTGKGICPENLECESLSRFSAKQSVGIGLGLWVTADLVRKRGGKIRVRSRPGKGTAFTVWIPIARREI